MLTKLILPESLSVKPTPIVRSVVSVSPHGRDLILLVVIDAMAGAPVACQVSDCCSIHLRCPHHGVSS